MESIVKLLFGREAGLLAEMFAPDHADESDLADRARRAGQWCASTPGHVSTPASRLTSYVHGMS
jgi:hypothetical protein